MASPYVPHPTILFPAKTQADPANHFQKRSRLGNHVLLEYRSACRITHQLEIGLCHVLLRWFISYGTGQCRHDTGMVGVG